MTPITITKRLVKGTPLTAEEHDANLQAFKTACEELNIEKYGKSNLTYNAEHYAISGAIEKKARNSFFSFVGQNGYTDLIALSGSKTYFKSLDKIIDKPLGNYDIKFPQAPVATNRVINGTFDTDMTNWGFIYSNGSGYSATSVNGEAEITSAVGYSEYIQRFSVTPGEVAVVEFISRNGTGEGWQVVVSDTLVNLVVISGTNITNEYKTISAIPATGTLEIKITATNGTAYYDNIAMFQLKDILCYDNLLLKDDGTYVITRTEQNQYITMDTMLNYTSKVYNVSDGSDTGTTITMTYDMTNEEYIGSDGHKYITVGATARLGQGAYHPVFNPYGCAKRWLDSVFLNYWYPSIPQVENIATCSRVGTIATSPLGGYYPSPTNSGRPDGKFHDIIYNELWIDQRWRAEWINGSKERNTLERDLDTSAGKFADFVGSATWETKNLKSRLNPYRSPNGVFSYDLKVVTDGNFNDLALYESYIITKVGKAVLTFSNGGEAHWTPVTKNNEVAMAAQLDSDIVAYGLLVCTPSRLRYGSNSFVHTDIIGNPANYPAVWKGVLTGGGSIVGTPLLVGDNGENYILLNTTTIGLNKYKLSEKAIDINQDIYTTNSLNWDTYTLGLNQNANTSSDPSFSYNGYPQSIVMLTYRAFNNNLVPTVNSKVVGSSAGVSDVATNYYFGEGDYIYSHLGNNLLNKVCTDPDSSDRGFMTPLTGFNWAESPMRLIGANITHAPISMHATTQPVVKLYSYLSDGATRHKQCYAFKEMKFDGPPVNQDGTPTYTFGDDNKFNTVDNVSTATDNNGNTILLGQKARLLDYRVKE